MFRILILVIKILQMYSSVVDDDDLSIFGIPLAFHDTLWYPDSGASHHLTTDITNLSTKSTCTGSDIITIGNGTCLHIQNIGYANCVVPHSCVKFILNNLLHALAITKNLLSVSQFAKENNVFFQFHSDHCCVKNR